MRDDKERATRYTLQIDADEHGQRRVKALCRDETTTLAFNAHMEAVRDTILTALADARREARFAVLQEANSVFCGGYSSSLSLQMMRDSVRREGVREGAEAMREHVIKSVTTQPGWQAVSAKWVVDHIRALEVP